MALANGKTLSHELEKKLCTIILSLIKFPGLSTFGILTHNGVLRIRIILHVFE